MSALEQEMLTVALSKGRILEPSVALLEKSGFALSGLRQWGRRLVIEDRGQALRFILAKPDDVPTYVEQGAADLGIVGKDILAEQERDLYELLDLEIGFCRMVVARRQGIEPGASPVVATKYPYITERHFHGRGMQAEIIKLHGSVELAPLLNMASLIVDLVATGKTLRENRLEEVEEIMPVTSRLVANRSSYQLKNGRIAFFCREIRLALAEGGKERD